MARLRAVLDTNVILSYQLSSSESSPAAECVERWEREEFTFLYSEDTIWEYGQKLYDLGIAPGVIKRLLSQIRFLAEDVFVAFFHLREYPQDQDDIAFLLCALNGEATHLVSYDQHLLVLRAPYADEMKVCEPIEFRADLRKGEN